RIDPRYETFGSPLRGEAHLELVCTRFEISSFFFDVVLIDPVGVHQPAAVIGIDDNNPCTRGVHVSLLAVGGYDLALDPSLSDRIQEGQPTTSAPPQDTQPEDAATNPAFSPS